MPESSSRPPLSTSAGGGGVGSTYPTLAGGPLGPPETWMMTAAWPLSWSELPPELLGLVLKRLPSVADRVRLRAVCHPWRFNAQLQPLPPPLPWLSLLDGTFLSIPDGEIFRIPLPDGACCCGSIDNWLFLMQSDGRCTLMNPFSKATLDLPNIGTVWCRDWFNASGRFKPLFYKLVVPSPLDLPADSIVAVLITVDASTLLQNAAFKQLRILWSSQDRKHHWIEVSSENLAFQKGPKLCKVFSKHFRIEKSH